MAKCPTCGAPVNLAPDGDPKYEPPRIAASPTASFDVLAVVRALTEVAIPSLKYCEDKYGHDDMARMNCEALLADIPDDILEAAGDG